MSKLSYIPDPYIIPTRNQMDSPKTSDGCNSSNNSNGWISVKDKLPNDHRHYIVVSKAEIVDAPVWYNGCQSWQMELAYYSQRYERWMTGDPTLKDVPENKITFEVTHWQELPEPPKEEG
jgi:hypothetical protein